MNQFLKFMLASMVGFFLSMFLIFIFSFFMITALVMSVKNDSSTTAVRDHTILEISLDHQIRERSSKNPLKGFDFSDWSAKTELGLDDILKDIRKAKSDERVDGIFLDLTSLQAGMATVEEIRNALLDFRKSKKFIYAYSEYMTQGAYYLSTAADRIYLHPEGSLDLRGLHANLAFFKGTLEKLEIEPVIIRHGKFKSAVEPFMYDRMSPENREQLHTVIGSIWDHMVERMSAGRNIEPVQLQRIVDDYGSRDPETALKLKLVDKLAYYDQVQADLRKASGIGEKEKPHLLSLRKYDKSYVKPETGYASRKIAIIYASGDIVSGDGNEDNIGSDRLSEAIRKARLDTSIRAIVLRVNSPGGSAIASDVIWRETLLARKAKPLVVSMGDYAASGGYYISCAADSIVAEPNTITGSIGVFGLTFNAQKMFNNKLGITFDTVKTGRYADFGSMTRPMTEGERWMIQEQTEKVYHTFISHVASGRHMSTDEVDSIGQGRVWSGLDAKRLGLVDVIGNIQTAIDIAARMARLETYRTVALPQQKEFFDKLMEDLNTETRSRVIQQELGASYPYYDEIRNMVNSQGVQARMPFGMEIK